MIVMPIRADNPPPVLGKQPQAQEPGEANPTDSETHQPAPDGANRERDTMPRTTTTTTTATNGAANGNGHRADAGTKPAIEVALEKIETIKGSYRESIRGLNDLADTLKQVQREQKTTEKDVQSVRTTLEKLQTVRI
jgi:hypothetical protein